MLTVFARAFAKASALLATLLAGLALAGEIAGQGELLGGSSVVRLILPDGGLCAGVAIERRIVLTAAHCLEDTGVLGVETVDEERFGVARVLLHPRYESGDIGEHDAALLLLTSPLPPAVEPAALAGPGSGAHLEWARLAGFGSGGVGSAGPSPYVERRLLPVLAGSLAQGGGLYGVRVLPPFPCYGDSGGPLLASRDGRAVVLGVVSAALTFRRRSDCLAGVTFAPADSLRHWIEAIIGTVGREAYVGRIPRTLGPSATGD